MTDTRTETEALADILAVLDRRKKAAEFDYDNARKFSDSTTAYYAECRASRDEARAAFRDVRRVLDSIRRDTLAVQTCSSTHGGWRCNVQNDPRTPHTWHAAVVEGVIADRWRD